MGPTCTHCEKKPHKTSEIFHCNKCYWVVCSSCQNRPRLPAIEDDSLFHGPDSPCLLSAPSNVPTGSRGTVIICPGGNYEFLAANEGLPVAAMLSRHNIR